MKSPNLEYHGTARFFWIVGVFFLFNVFFVLSLRQWARYYLNRKLFLSYVLALIPVLLTGLIFTYGFRSWFGLSNTLNIEKTLEIAASDLSSFVERVELEAYQTGIPSSEKISKIVKQSAESEFRDQNLFDTELLQVAIYYLTPKEPGQPRYLIPYYVQNQPQPESQYIQQETEAYDNILPDWIPRRAFTDIITIDEQLFVQQFSLTEWDPGELLIIAAMPLGVSFLNEMRAVQPAKISLSNQSGSQYFTSDSPDSAWYLAVSAQTALESLEHSGVELAHGILREIRADAFRDRSQRNHQDHDPRRAAAYFQSGREEAADEAHLRLHAGARDYQHARHAFRALSDPLHHALPEI